MSTLRAKLIEWQAAEGMDDGAFAARLGVERTYWNRMKRGERRLSTPFVARVLSLRPEFAAFISPSDLLKPEEAAA